MSEQLKKNVHKFKQKISFRTAILTVAVMWYIHNCTQPSNCKKAINA